MAHTIKTDRTSLADRRRARLAAELRSNLKKRKQQARIRAERVGEADAAGRDRPGAPSERGERKGETA